jgi:N-sulfoglucosamine sulfohydrolase
MRHQQSYKLVTIVIILVLVGIQISFKAVKANDQLSEKRPNILWISCEDISPHLGCYGDQVAKTPNLDQLAAQGMRFTRCFTSSPVCAPVRSGIITGMYPTTIGTHHMRTSHRDRSGELPTPYQTVPPPYVKAFTEYLRAAGYYCTNNSKTDYQFTDFSYTPITIWDACSQTAHWKNRPDKNQPFFAVFNDTQTHESKTWQEPELTDPAAVEVPPYYPDTQPVRKSIARLYDQIHKMDTRAGELLRELEAAGLADNTIVFFWGDHGDGLPRAKRWPYDSGTLIPLIIKWPGSIKAGSVSNDLISSIDFGPTVLSMAGVDIPVWMQGRAFLGDQKDAPRDYVFSHRDRFDESYDMMRSVRDKRFRYVRNYYTNQPYIQWIPYRNNSPIMQELLRLQAEDGLEESQKLWFRTARDPEELYDCEADPFHLHNLAADPGYKKELHRLSTVLDEWQHSTNDLGGIPESELKRRWWPNGEQPQTNRVWFIPNTASNRGNNRIEAESAEFTSPVLIDFYCATEGASMAYTLKDEKEAPWKIVNGPIRLPKGKTLLRARAVRYGYKESIEARCEIIVK